LYTIANIRPFGHNVGNTAINFALRNKLYERFGRLVSVIDYPATSRYESNAKAGLTKQTIYEINRFADGVIVGGGNLYENNEIEIDVTSLAYLQPPLMLFSNSRGRIYGRDRKLQERTDVIPDNKLQNLVDAAAISASRDTATHEYIKSMGGSDVLGYCPTVNLGKYKPLLPTLPQGETVGALISIRTPSLMNLPISQQSSVQKQIETAILALRETGYERIRILCNDSRDLDFAVQFKGSLSVDPVYTSDVYQYLALLAECSILVSYRLHATLPAISFGNPVVNITYDERAESLCEDLGVQEHSIKMMDPNLDVTARIDEMIRGGGYVSSEDDRRKLKWKNVGVLHDELIDAFKERVLQYVTAVKSG